MRTGKGGTVDAVTSRLFAKWSWRLVRGGRGAGSKQKPKINHQWKGGANPRCVWGGFLRKAPSTETQHTSRGSLPPLGRGRLGIWIQSRECKGVGDTTGSEKGARIRAECTLGRVMMGGPLLCKFCPLEG